jgi:hypothetical protein
MKTYTVYGKRIDFDDTKTYGHMPIERGPGCDFPPRHYNFERLLQSAAAGRVELARVLSTAKFLTVWLHAAERLRRAISFFSDHPELKSVLPGDLDDPYLAEVFVGLQNTGEFAAYLLRQFGEEPLTSSEAVDLIRKLGTGCPVPSFSVGEKKRAKEYFN